MSARQKRPAQFVKLGALLVFAGSAFFVAPYEAQAKERNIFIGRVQIAGNTVDEDFVEIHSDENCALDLSGWKLRKRTASGTESSVKVFDTDAAILPPGETLLWANSKNNFAKTLGAHQESATTLTENNSLALFDTDDILIDSLSWGTISEPFRNSESNAPNPQAHKYLIRISKSGEIAIQQTDPPQGKSFDASLLDICGTSNDRSGDSNITLSEILANPIEDEAEGEFIELENRSEKAIDLSGWKLRDDSKTGKYIFPEGSAIEPKTFLTIFRKTFVFALNNSGETVTLEDAKGAKADTISWQTARENNSLARDGARWRNTKFLTPGEANRFGNDPSSKTKIPKQGFAGIPLSFSAKITDLDRDPTKVTWNFGDGHRSYIKETSHTFTKKGRYTVTLTATDGIADITKTFRVEIKKYEAPKVRVTSLVPNPEGKDTKNEYLVIENRSKKEVNLKGWKIATKSKRTTKNFVNHAITKDFIIKPDASKKLTEKYAAFTLGNTRQYLELRDPRGKTVQSLRYKLEKSAPENAEFFKMPNQPWQWKIPLPLDTKTKEV